MEIILQADLHTHTLASTHAYSTIRENCICAAENGLKCIAMTDHMVNMPDSPHIWHFENLKCLPRTINGVFVLKGCEANIIDKNGTLDLPEFTAKSMEWVVASMHKQTFDSTGADDNTAAYLAAAKNPIIDVIGHPTTDMFPFDHEKCLLAFKENDKLVEINESSIINKKGSRKNSIEILKLCKKYEIPVVIDTDAHFCENIGKAPQAFELVRQTDFPTELIYNADFEKIRAHVLKKHPNCGL